MTLDACCGVLVLVLCGVACCPTEHQALSEDSGRGMVRKSHWVNVDDLFTFLFPPGMQHPRSTGRLIVFGEYGPFADDGTLRAGWRGRHRITDRELKTMIDEIEREDLIAIFVVRAALLVIRHTVWHVECVTHSLTHSLTHSPHTRGVMLVQKDRGLDEEKKQEILQGADESKNKLPNMNREQISGILSSLPRNDVGDVSFHDLQRCVVWHAPHASSCLSVTWRVVGCCPQHYRPSTALANG